MAITYFLARKRVVVYTDGDVVFLRRSFLRETVAPLGKWRSGSGEKKFSEACWWWYIFFDVPFLFYK